MKFMLILAILAALLGGCAITPSGYGENRGGNDRDRDHGLGDWKYGLYS